ncbi:MAG: chemotaxis protein CheW [Anaeromicrobium sp.]|jgi:purine-binding chemotaxis protein CheW|uniref:chemotaxis protein CheW n=1 Tax=Anaeromicrobium sp. TaxID=1929132 RepID=UPI0025D8431B|nr:chemotaxis protein CheW [Anaeromicrobium sp.]MCT4595604.1 chemotaxis protein CheW [Anaeromicrobium sp.]
MSENVQLLENQYVLFELGKEYYGIDIHNVQTIEKVIDITRVPHSPTYVEGVINLRGEIIPVINLRTRLNLENVQLTSDSRIIITKCDEVIVGLLVDSSSEVIKLDKIQLEDAPKVSENVSEKNIKAIGKDKERIIILLDIEGILQS